MTPVSTPVAVILLGTDPQRSRGGIAAVLPAYVSLLARMGIPHRLIVTHSNDHLSGKFRHITRGLPALIAAIREYRAQKLIPVVHAHTGKWPSLIRKRLLLAVAKSAGARTILHLHGAEIQDYLNNPIQRRVLSRILRGVDMVLTLTPHWSKLVASCTGVSTRVLANPLSPELTQEALTPLAKRQTSPITQLLSMNRLIPGKGYEFLIEVVARLPGSIRLTLAGDGELLDSLKARARQSGCEDRVTFAGWVSGPAKRELYRSADAFCLFTERDSLSTVLVEAMSYGLPIIAYEYGPTLDVVPTEAGLIIRRNASAEEAALAIAALTPEQYHTMALAAKRWVIASYDADHIAQEWLSILRHVCTATAPERYAER